MIDTWRLLCLWRLNYTMWQYFMMTIMIMTIIMITLLSLLPSWQQEYPLTRKFCTWLSTSTYNDIGSWKFTIINYNYDTKLILTHDIIDIQHLFPGINIGEDTVPDLWGSDFDHIEMLRYWEFEILSFHIMWYWYFEIYLIHWNVEILRLLTLWPLGGNGIIW